MNKHILTKPSKLNIPRTSLGCFIYDACHKFENSICQIDSRTQECETFMIVHKKSVRVALEMLKQGVTPDDVVVTCTATTLDSAIPIIATFYVGARIANLDVTLSVLQTSHLLSLVSPKIIFVDEQAVNLIEESLKSAGLKSTIVVLGVTTNHLEYGDFLKPQLNEDLFKPATVDPDKTAIIFFSSGSSGFPKGVAHSSWTFINEIFNLYSENMSLDVILSFTSFYWVTAMYYLCSCFINGGHRIICGNKLDPTLVFKAIEKHKVTFVFLAPILATLVVNYEDWNRFDVSSVKTVVCSGSPLSCKIFNKLNEVFKNSAVTSGYGQTEAGFVSIFDPVVDRALIESKLLSCGKLLSGLSLKVVDPETRELKGPNERGEICVKGSSLMKGYYNSKDTNVFDQDGFLGTGDLGYYDDDGCVYVVDRLKEMFKYLSWHIVPSMLEEVLRDHPAVLDCIVFGLPVGEEEGELPTACVVLKNNVEADVEEISNFVANKVSDREKLRGGLYIVKEIPKTPSGKISRFAAKSKFLNMIQNKIIS